MTDTCTGILDWVSPQECRLRQFENGIIIRQDDPLVPLQLAESIALRDGMRVEATVVHKRPRRRSGKTWGNVRAVVETLLKIEGMSPEAWHSRKPFAELTAIDPSPRMALEHPGCPPACRLIDLFCPIGFGTRGLIVSPPKAGKTVLLQQIAKGIHHNYPDVKLVALLIDERPEEVTDFRRNVPAEVMASSNDEAVERHIELGLLAVDRAKRLLEAGQDVVLLLDSLTRLGRAFNNSPKYGNSGRTMSGGLDSRALEVPKQLFGAARKAEEGGSLTILATCLVDTGSRADQVIFEEFKGTGNMELILDRSISDQRLYPAINLADSGTRREDLLLNEVECKTVTALRRRLMSMKPAIQIEQLLKALTRFKTNDDLVRG
jgi:transcription termination factor Rho